MKFEPKIYIRGTHHGLYGAGAIVQARRNDSPEVEEGMFYEISEVVTTDVGACGKNLLVRLVGLKEMYDRRDFRVNQDCADRMKNDSNTL